MIGSTQHNRLRPCIASRARTKKTESQDGMLKKTSKSSWKHYWDEKNRSTVSDYQVDRGTRPRNAEIETLSNEELLGFIAAEPTDVVFDAGCGTGANILLLQPCVCRIIGMDYSEVAVARCKKRLALTNIRNVKVFQGNVTSIPLPDDSVDRVLCMSVLQYLDDAQLRAVFREFARILKKDGALVLHVKNLASLYLSTLWLAKHLLRVVGRDTKLEYFRTFRGYVGELRAAGFRVLNYRSLNVLILERMPRKLVLSLQKFELSHQNHFPFSSGFLRRHGPDLKIRAQLQK
jgi:ubiquinone/menaquinone biosynthesis C-methylase UbiE